MKEAIGGMWILGIVMTFMVILITFVTLSLDYSTVFRLKSDILTKIEECGGFNATAKTRIDGIIADYGYKVYKNCQFKDKASEAAISKSNVLGLYKEGGATKPLVNDFSTKVNYCIQRERVLGVAETLDKAERRDSTKETAYYKIQMFFGFELPVLGDIFTFRVEGETNPITYPDETFYKDYFNM